MEYDITWAFDIEKHKEKYVNYLEVLIAKDGKIMYAVPSHQEKAVALACEALGKSRKEVERLCPAEYHYDYMTWLLMQSGAIAVWNEFVIAPAITRKQIGALRKLKMYGLYKGKIPIN